MTDAAHDRPLFSSALRGIFASLGSDIAQKVLGVATTLVVLGALVPYDYGLWQLLLSVVIAVDVILLPAIASMLIADVSREIGAGARDRAGAIVARAVPLFIALGVLGTIVLFLAAPLITQISGIDVTWSLQVLSLSLFAVSIRQGYQLVLQGSLMLVHAQALKAVDRFSYVLCLGVFVLLFGLNLSGVVYAYTAAAFLPILFYAPVVIPQFFALIKGRTASRAPFIEAVWERGRWALAGDILAAVTAGLFPWIIGYYLSIAEVGFITLAIMILGQVVSLAPVGFVLRSVLPRTLSTEGRTRAWLVRSMKYAVWSQIAGGVAALGIVAFAVPIFFPAYKAVVPIAAAILLTLPIRVMGVVASEWFYAAKQQRMLFFVSNVPKLALLALLPLFLIPFKLLGFVLWYLFNADVITYLRLRLVAREEGGALTFREVVVPDRQDMEIGRQIYRAILAKVGASRNPGPLA